MKKILFLFAPSLIFLSMFSLTKTYSLFSDSAMSANNTFTAAAEFPEATPSGLILINEVFQSSSNSAEWVELFNPTNNAINISNWSIEDNNATDSFSLISPIPASGYAIIVSQNSIVSGIPGTAITIQLATGLIGNGLAQAGDKLFLRDSSKNLIDSVGWGTNSIFTTPIPTPPARSSIARMPNGTDTDTASDWVIDNTPTIGETNL